MGLFRYYIKGDSPPPSAELPWRQLVPLAAACVGFYLAAATRRLLDRDVLRRLLWPFPETSALSVILCLTLVIAVKVTVWLWLVPSSPGISVRHFIKTTSLLALVKPGIFFCCPRRIFRPDRVGGRLALVKGRAERPVIRIGRCARGRPGDPHEHHLGEPAPHTLYPPLGRRDRLGHGLGTALPRRPGLLWFGPSFSPSSGCRSTRVHSVTRPATSQNSYIS